MANPMGGFLGGIGRAVGGMLGGPVGGFLGNLLTPGQQNANQGPGEIVPEPPTMMVHMYNRAQYDLSNKNIPGLIANQNAHMQKAADMAENTSRAVGDTMRQNANRVTHNRSNQMRLAGQQAMANAEATRSQAIVEQARQDAMARRHESNAKTERLRHAMRML
jgi:hypothetical protein